MWVLYKKISANSEFAVNSPLLLYGSWRHHGFTQTQNPDRSGFGFQCLGTRDHRSGREGTNRQGWWWCVRPLTSTRRDRLLHQPPRRLFLLLWPLRLPGSRGRAHGQVTHGGHVLDRSASPAPDFRRDWLVVKEGETICIIEAMKILNEIEADRAGTIARYIVRQRAGG